MPFLLRGALIEYSGDFLGPIPNVILFQFNPESLARTIQIPQRPTGSASRETSQAGDAPVEHITLTAYFSAANMLNTNNILARTVGIGPQLAALEKMVRPAGKLGGMIGAALDAVGGALGLGGGGSSGAAQPVPREKFPQTLFIWGPTRVLPVLIDSMVITEQEYDFLLNPIRAEVSLGLSVITIGNCSDDKVAKGALEYSNMAKDAMAIANLANTVSQIIDMIPF
jgi:hypothetical protein